MTVFSVPCAALISATVVCAQPTDFILSDFDAGDIPAVVQRAPETVQRMWAELQQELESKPPERRQAELLIRRARLLLAVSSRLRAFRDFESAAKIVAGYSTTNSQAVLRFRQLLSEHAHPREPPPHRGVHLGEVASAGYRAYQEGNLRQAIDAFTVAIRYAPFEPSYYYFRAFAYKRLGLDIEADNEARWGAFLEFQALRSHWPNLHRENVAYVSVRMIRVQGPLRLWLEQYRLVKHRSSEGTVSEPD